LALEPALADFERAIALRPDYASAHHFRGNVLRSLQRIDAAAAAYRSALACGADPAQLEYALASIGIGAVPAGAPEAYLKNLFDNYAGHFDQHLLQQLDYQIPAHIEAAIQRCQPRDALLTIDLGCGTGLCGEFLRRSARRLIGVDLSQPMLDKAAERGLYNELVCADIVQFLQTFSACPDLVVAADVLVYLGDLQPLLHAVRQLSSPGTLFCFSVEEGEGTAYALQASNRFCHSPAYLRAVALACDFDVLALDFVVGRRDHGLALPSIIATLRRA
jgi:predicted TPR repeat methyltransferase